MRKKVKQKTAHTKIPTKKKHTINQSYTHKETQHTDNSVHCEKKQRVIQLSETIVNHFCEYHHTNIIRRL